MDSVSLAPVLTPHGHLSLIEEKGSQVLDFDLSRRLHEAFTRGAGHGLLQLGAGEAGTALPPAFAYWREFSARYVTALCTQPDTETLREKLHVPPPPEAELQELVLSAPVMTGAEYLTPEILHALWQELDVAFRLELAESKCGVQDFLKRRNPAWNLVGQIGR